MSDRRIHRSLTLLVALALGCAAFSHEPERLLEQARKEIKLRNYADAYGHLAEIRTRYPRSPVSAEAFDEATFAFHALYFRNRFTPESEWMKTQPVFMLEWLATFFGGDEFPQARVEKLVRGMPRAFFDDYRAYAASHPKLARWDVQVTDDNGLIDSITAVRSDEARDSAG